MSPEELMGYIGRAAERAVNSPPREWKPSRFEHMPPEELMKHVPSEGSDGYPYGCLYCPVY